MPDLQTKFKEAWSQALVGLNAAEAEAEKVLARLADAAGLTPEDVKHHAREFGERLTQQRREVERAIDDGVRRAAAQFRIPTRDEVEALRKRVDQIADRLEVIAQQRARKE
ncbi:MAG TPA: phasin family protein [Anaeromyxobacteraceae bacterium]|jgi:polyhydroxyalkanoate synthesis regulator phasin|nr:phasin family protein [Anaeromyxobacteraceae bacterium]